MNNPVEATPQKAQDKSVKLIRYWKDDHRIIYLENQENASPELYNFSAIYEGLPVLWDSRPFKTHIFDNHEQLVLLILLRERLVRNLKSSVAFLRRLRCLGAQLPLLETLADFFSGKPTDALGIQIIKEGFETFLKSREQICALTNSLFLDVSNFKSQHTLYTRRTISVAVNLTTPVKEHVEVSSEMALEMEENNLLGCKRSRDDDNNLTDVTPLGPEQPKQDEKKRYISIRVLDPIILSDIENLATVKIESLAELSDESTGKVISQIYENPKSTGKVASDDEVDDEDDDDDDDDDDDSLPVNDDDSELKPFQLPAEVHMKTELQRDKSWLVFSPMQLKTAAIVPCLTTDMDGLLAVFIGRGKGSNGDVNLLCPSFDKSELEQSCDIDALMKVWAETGRQMAQGLDSNCFEVSEVVVIAIDCSKSMSKPLLNTPQSTYNGVDVELSIHDVDANLADFTFKLIIEDKQTGIWLAVQILGLKFSSVSTEALFRAARAHRDRMIENKREEDRQAVIASQQQEAEAEAEATTVSSSEFLVPDGFLCPISHSIMSDPVLAGDGRTYEREAITEWLEKHSTSPVTREELISTALTPNYALRDVIEQLKTRADFRVRNRLVALTPKRLFHIVSNGLRREYNVESRSQAEELFLNSVVTNQPSIMNFRYRGTPVARTEDDIVAEKAKWSFHPDSHDSSVLYAINQPVEMLNFSFRYTPEFKISLPNYLTILDLYLKVYPLMVNKILLLSHSEVDIGDGYIGDGVHVQANRGLQQLFSVFKTEKSRENVRRYILARSNPDTSSRDGDENAFSKMSLAKTVFNSFIDKSSSFNLPHAYGLIQFSDEVTEVLPIQLSLELFRDCTEELEPERNTSIFDAIHLGIEMIRSYAGKKSANCVSRILMLTDGSDTSSKVTTLGAVKKLLKKHNVLLDIITLGDGVTATVLNQYPGNKFIIRTEQEAVMLSEMETFLRSNLRAANKYKRDSIFGVIHDADARKTSANGLNLKLAPALSESAYLPKTTGPTNKDVLAKLRKDLQDILKNPNPEYSVQLVEERLFHWRVTFKGPEETPYEGGYFDMSLIAEGDFPSNPPDCRFYIPVVPHCNISAHGSVCHSVLGRNWNPTNSLKLVLDCIYGLFLTPEPDDPLQMILASLMHTEPETYETTIREVVLRDFTRPCHPISQKVTEIPKEEEIMKTAELSNSNFFNESDV